MKGQDKRKSEDLTLALSVNWEQKTRVTKGIAKGTYYKTYYDTGEFAGWRTKQDIQTNYPNSQ